VLLARKDMQGKIRKEMAHTMCSSVFSFKPFKLLENFLNALWTDMSVNKLASASELRDWSS